MWSGHSCPLLLILTLANSGFVVTALHGQTPEHKINVKGGGQECPPHTNGLRNLPEIHVPAMILKHRLAMLTSINMLF